MMTILLPKRRPARHYNPQLARWMALDPMAETSEDMNPYNFVENNPMILIDPDGMQSSSPDFSYGASGASAGAGDLSPFKFGTNAGSAGGSSFGAVFGVFNAGLQGINAAKAFQLKSNAVSYSSTMLKGVQGNTIQANMSASMNAWHNTAGQFIGNTVYAILEGAFAPLNALSDNTPKNPQLRKAAIKESQQNVAKALLFYGGGEIFGKGFQVFGDLTKSVVGRAGGAEVEMLEEANAAKIGWKVGEKITNLTSKGEVPGWNTVRARFWKNEAFYNSSEYEEGNLIRMKKGLAPQFRNTETGVMESMELHHTPIPQRHGGLFNFIKVTPSQHKLIDPLRQ